LSLLFENRFEEILVHGPDARAQHDQTRYEIPEGLERCP
jgi:hypothetical protein